jgi:HAD superfamily hydrolase (TIGR01509 family)
MSSTQQSLRAVLFDMDGTLVETEQYWGEAMFALARRLGGQMSDSARQQTIGTSLRVSMNVLYADLGITRSERQFCDDARWVEDETGRQLADGVSWRPGARELVAAVRDAGLASALVTTTPRKLADLVLAHIGETAPGVPAFDFTVCGDEVAARKPDPAPYRQAMAALDVEPSGCVVIEDSHAGITAGLASGAAVLGVPVMQAVDPAPGLVLRDGLVGVGLDELAEVLAELALLDAPA